MKVITKIGRQKNNPERYNIYLDETYAFAVDEGTLIKFGLMKGKSLEQFDIDEIVYEDEIAKAFNKALNFLSYQMRSEQEVRKKLLSNEYGEAVVDSRKVKGDTVMQKDLFMGNEYDRNGILLYPDGAPRFRILFIQGGTAAGCFCG